MLQHLPLELLCHICHYDIFSYETYHGSSTGVDLGVVRHGIQMERYFLWAKVCKWFRCAVQEAIRIHEHGSTVLLRIQDSLGDALAALEALMLQCPKVEAVRVSATAFLSDNRDTFEWKPEMLGRQVQLDFVDFDPSMPHDMQWQWLAVIINCMHPLVREVVISSDFNHFGLPVSVFDAEASQELADEAPIVPIVFQNCMLESRPLADENFVGPPVLASLFPYLLELSHPITLKDCWSLRVMLGAADPNYQEYLQQGGDRSWSDWQDHPVLSADFDGHDKMALYPLLDPMEVRLLSQLGVEVLPTTWIVQPEEASSPPSEEETVHSDSER
jgi:hypothetical protein